MVTSRHEGFTLVELLVVVAIIILLVSILAPTVGRALEQSRRAACVINVREIARAVRTYALTNRLHRGSTLRCLPDVDPTSANWFTADGNRACLWLLVKYKYTSTQTFICPSLDDFSAAKITDLRFEGNTCGYSFISMVDQARSLDNSYVSLAIVADLNPRFKPGSSTIYDYRDFDQDDSIDAEERKLADELSKEGKLGNSAAHGHDGQNVGLLDGSADFLTTAIVKTGSNSGDLIYESTSPGSDADGKCRSVDDVLLLD